MQTRVETGSGHWIMFCTDQMDFIWIVKYPGIRLFGVYLQRMYLYNTQVLLLYKMLHVELFMQLEPHPVYT